MRPAQVTESQIIAAGRQLEASGRQVTANALRTSLGAGNPRRLYSVWESLASSASGPRFDSGTLAHRDELAQAPAADARVSLEQKIEALTAELAGAKKEIERQAKRASEIQLVADVVTDDRNKYKERCAALEASIKHMELRIADQLGRIDEQRSELHRGAQARLALENALSALHPLASTPLK